MLITCPYCKNKAEVKTGYVNRAKKIGAPKYCSKLCSALARSYFRTDEEKKKIKAEYDKKFRKVFSEKIKKKKSDAFKKDYAENPDKYKKIRIKRKEEHNEYCRQPEYKKWKKAYDHKFKMKEKYGEFWESGSALVQLNEELDSKQIKYNQGIINKSQKRKRTWRTKQS